jgi:hypothetical protein
MAAISVNDSTILFSNGFNEPKKLHFTESNGVPKVTISPSFSCLAPIGAEGSKATKAFAPTLKEIDPLDITLYTSVKSFTLV